MTFTKVKVIGIMKTKFISIILLCFLFSFNSWGKEIKNWKFFAEIKELWLNKEHSKLFQLMDKRINLNLGTYPRIYPREQVAGILKRYFSKIKILKFKYNKKKMSESRGVAFYKYQKLSTGLLEVKRIYFYVSRKKGRWVITSIGQINLNSGRGRIE